MNRLFLALLCLMLCTRSGAQNIFAPMGTEWYYDCNNVAGVFHNRVVTDTVIMGQACRGIQQRGIPVLPPGSLPSVTRLNTLYTYSTGDTVFVYNDYFRRFTPLYVFNIQAGDTVTLPVIDAAGGLYYQHNLADSNFYLVVDSVRNVRYDTSFLKTVYSHSVQPAGGNGLRIAWDSENVYARQIGGLNGILPICANCSPVIDGGMGFPGSLRCYHDSTTAIKLIAGDCSAGLTEAIATTPASAQVNVYPNPASESIHLTGSGVSALVAARILSVMGQLLYQGVENNIHVRHLPNGYYLLQMSFRNGSSMQRLVWVQH